MQVLFPLLITIIAYFFLQIIIQSEQNIGASTSWRKYLGVIFYGLIMSALFQWICNRWLVDFFYRKFNIYLKK